MSATSKSVQVNDERIFFFAALAGSAMLMTGLLFALVALNKPAPTGDTGPGDPLSRAIPPDRPRQLAAFSLTNWNGSNITRAAMKGKFLVVDFLFTSCSETCPIVNSHMAEIQELTTNQPDVKLVSLTVDPRDDTPPVLANYAKRFGADPSRWLLLTGDRDQLYGLIGQSFLTRDLDNSFGYMPGNFANTYRIAVVDPSGVVRAYFDGLNDNSPEAVLNEISALRKEAL
jgi:protein SCO1/2